MEQTGLLERNPWEDDQSALGTLKAVLALAHSTGHISSKLNDDSDRDMVITEAENKFLSLKLIQAMRDVDSKRIHLEKVNLEIQERLLDKETRDLTHRDVLDKRIQDINNLNSHLQTIVNEKDQLIAKLQQPYVGDFLKVEANYKRYVAEVFPQLAPVLSDLSSELQSIEWTSKVDLSDGQLESLLSDIYSSLATLQSGFQGVIQMRQAVSQLHSKKVIGESLVDS